MYTKDEQLIISLYELALERGDAESECERSAVGSRANISDKTMKALCQQLVRGNFIRKASESEIYLTEQGILLAQRLLEERGQ